ncbi:hypothetical protein LCGC14_0413820 [marine sediment metagenome]|uniref:SF4 helicase domain-containing protein n=1 Tax=marine sediment metagenome TaxID=412755 RepID=A0A0F9VET6_9ZZZZ
MDNVFLRGYQEHLVGKMADKKFMSIMSHSIIEECFDEDLAPIVKKSLTLWRRKGEVLTLTQMRAISPSAQIAKTNGSFTFDLENLSLFGKASEIRNRITEAKLALEEGQIDEAQQLLKEPVKIGREDGESFSFFSKRKKVGKGRGIGINTGLPTLDGAMGGICPGEVALVIGETNVGKTSWLINVAVESIIHGFNTFFVSMEQPAHSMNSKFDSAFRVRTFDRKKAGNLYIHCTSPHSQTPAELESRLERDGGLVDLIILDSLDLIRAPRRWGSRWEEEGETVLDIKAWGLRASSRLWVSTQANRMGYGGDVVRTGHVKGSLEKVQLVDHVISLNPPTGELLPGEETTDIRLYHAKNRFGLKVGTINLECRMKYCEFKECEY